MRLHNLIWQKMILSLKLVLLAFAKSNAGWLWKYGTCVTVVDENLLKSYTNSKHIAAERNELFDIEIPKI